jgi:hypothetical protein
MAPVSGRSGAPLCTEWLVRGRSTGAGHDPILPLSRVSLRSLTARCGEARRTTTLSDLLIVVLVTECVLAVVAVTVTSVQLTRPLSALWRPRLRDRHASSAAGLAPGLRAPQRMTAALPTLERPAEAN